MHILHEYSGILFIGDPHLSSRRIGRRIDDYLATSINKLRQALNIANANNLAPIILGDLFHKATDTDPLLLTMLFDLLKHFELHVFVLVGNHDIKNTILTPDTALATVKATGLATILDTQESVIFENLCVIHPVPYGFKIPDNVSNEYGLPNIVITHHDLDFGQPNPEAIPLKEVKGANLVVNGHLHTTLKPKAVGSTIYANIGNIVRLTIDTADNKPSVFAWQKDKPNSLTQIPLKFAHKENVFDFTGKNVQAAEKLYTANFVEALKEDLANNVTQTQDGAVIKEEIDRIAVEEKIDSEVVSVVYELLNKAVAEN